MSDRPSPRPSPLYGSSGSRLARFSSVNDAVSTPGASDSVLRVTSAALGGLKDIMEALNTLPCVKYIASVAVKILEIIDVGQSDFQ